MPFEGLDKLHSLSDCNRTIILLIRQMYDNHSMLISYIAML